ncbi:hypothetical protein GQ44DRAFT_788988 [Phaeosphaeriaceae sp. PMI808]|nr:hypothetical protein GQ44DRAFT_788988 [Phaeosphaeriaceae sp. PMI808]
MEQSNEVPPSATRPLPGPELGTCISGIDAIFREQEHRWLTHYDALKSLRHNNSALSDFLSTSKVELQASLKPFLEGLRSSRLRLLSEAEIEPHDSKVAIGFPCIFQVSVAESHLDLDSVWGMAIMNIEKGSIYEGSRMNDPLTFNPSFVREFTSGISAGEPKFAMNIPLKEDILLHPPPVIASLYHIYQEEGTGSVFSACANIGTLGSVVDIHEGMWRMLVYQHRFILKLSRQRFFGAHRNG